MSDGILKVIEDLQSDEELTSLSEAHVSQSVILRILDALNWSIFDHREVSSQHSVEKKSVDLALLTSNKTTVFIEVKKGGESLEKHQEQLLDYAFRQGVKIAILTNGITWWFYLSLRAVSWEQRKFTTVELNKQNRAEIVQKLVDLLSRENVRSGKAFQNADALYKKHRISATLPEAWNHLVSEPEGLIVDLLVKKTQELCGEETDKSEVERFLLAHLQNIKITSAPVAIEPVPVPEPEPPDHKKDTKTKAFTVTKPKAFILNEQRCEVKSWKEMLVKLCEIVYTAHEERFEQQVSEIKGKPDFSRNPDALKQGREINGTGIYVEMPGGANSAKRFAEKLITHFGYDKNDLKFEIQ